MLTAWLSGWQCGSVTGKRKHAYTLNYDGDHGSIAPAKH